MNDKHDFNKIVDAIREELTEVLESPYEDDDMFCASVEKNSDGSYTAYCSFSLLGDMGLVYYGRDDDDLDEINLIKNGDPCAIDRIAKFLIDNDRID